MITVFKKFFWLLFFSSLVISCHDQPIEVEDSYQWQTSTPEEQGLDGNIIKNYIQDIRSQKYGDIHSFLIFRHGVLVTEEYFAGYNKNTLHQVYSVTKSITSCLIGIALDQSKIPGIRTNLLFFFPEYSDISNLDDNKKSIVLEDVLTMRAGFEWNELLYPYTDYRNPLNNLRTSPDWVKYVLDLPMQYSPGIRFQYNSGCTILLSGILRNRTGMQAVDYATKNLFPFIDITYFQWDSGSNGLTNTYGGLHLWPRDMAKFGHLYLYDGKWNGKQIVPKEWVQTSRTKHLMVNNSYSYGYQWWQITLLPDPLNSAYSNLINLNNEIEFAWGYGGQYIFIIRSLDIVIVSTAGDYGEEYEGALKFIQEMLRKIVKHE